MTDRYAGVLVTFERDIRDDDAENTIIALGHVRGVLSVEPVAADVLGEVIAFNRRDREWTDGLVALIERMARS